MIKLYIGGSPCTHWSIAKTKGRETEPSGIGWELFKNYVIGLKKYKPDYFLYENNKSMAPAIKEQITKELGVEPILINSSLVSAQNRQRLYWTNIPRITQPEDKGILLKDILETGVCWRDKSYTLDANYYRTAGTYDPTSQHSYSRHMVAEPVRIGTMPNEDGKVSDSQGSRIYSQDGKSVSLKANGGGLGAKTGLYAVPCCVAQRGRYTGENGETEQHLEIREDGKTNTLTTVQKDNMVVEGWDGKTYPVYEVKNGLITIKDKQYPIKLIDGYYIIRKLTVKECMRLQTVPETYIFPVSDSQAYKQLGNGWTVDVIAHQLSFIPGITTEEIEVLSMYDGMSCGHIALDKLGANVIRYYATEIDKYAIQTTKHNYPDTIHLGDAYQVRGYGFILTSYSGKSYDTENLVKQMDIFDYPEVLP